MRRTENSDILKGLGCVLLVAIPGGWIILLLMLLFSQAVHLSFCDSKLIKTCRTKVLGFTMLKGWLTNKNYLCKIPTRKRSAQRFYLEGICGLKG